MKLFRRLMVVLNVVLVICTLGSYISPYIDPSSLWIFSVFGLAYPILLGLNVLFAVYWMFVEFKYSSYSIIVLLIGYIPFRDFLAFNSPLRANDSTAISVVSYNISNGANAYHRDKKVKHKRQAAMLDFLKRFDDEDILCFQEVGPYASDLIKKSISERFIHQLDKGTIIVSKHRMVNKGQVEFGTRTNSCLWADILIGYDTVRVYSTHLQSNRITRDADKVLDEPDLNNDKTWMNIKGIFAKYVKSHIKRSRQAEEVKQHMDASPYPIIFCGDLNDTPLTYTYKKLCNGLNDNFTTSGSGLGTTFNGRIPLLRIDYILTSPQMIIHNFNIIKENHSDHYPIASILSIRESE